jgi:hypothetical protein
MGIRNHSDKDAVFFKEVSCLAFKEGNQVIFKPLKGLGF